MSNCCPSYTLFGKGSAFGFISWVPGGIIPFGGSLTLTSKPASASEGNHRDVRRVEKQTLVNNFTFPCWTTQNYTETSLAWANENYYSCKYRAGKKNLEKWFEYERIVWYLALDSLHFLKKSTFENMCLLETALSITEPAASEFRKWWTLRLLPSASVSLQESFCAAECNMEVCLPFSWPRISKADW